MEDFWDNKKILKNKFDLIQINIGNLCNQTCTHCHIGASPQGEKNMTKDTAIKIIDKILQSSIKTIEFTGGTPEMNGNFESFIIALSEGGKSVVVRTSLSVLDEPEYQHFVELYKKYRIKVIASLPSVFEDLTTKQRGEGIHDRSIKMLQKLNEIGYAKKSDLKLDLVYNPVGTYFPSPQNELQKEYKTLLKDNYDIEFNTLSSIVNMPIKRFKKNLVNQNELDSYMKRLRDNYNASTLSNLMCKRLLSIDYAGDIYDCDFNLALGIKIKGYEDKKFWDIEFDDFKPYISFDSHCYACTVNCGSSCHGEVIKFFDAKDNAKNYYGSVLSSSSDLKTAACCTLDSIPARVKEVLPYIADEIKDKYYGCGSPMPLVLENQKMLDLGCGSGRDVYVLSKLVGEGGFVHGIDMTANQINVAKKYQESQAKRFDYKEPNTNFIQDNIENIDKHFDENSLDIITSNCVINLLEDKQSILKKIFTILKNGGEFYFSDVYSSRRLSKEIKENPVLHGECLGGTLYVNDFIKYAIEAGFTEPRLVSQKEIEITDKKVKKLTKDTRFYSMTYRLWKIKDLDMVCEEYGQVARYIGGAKSAEEIFELDENHYFEKNRFEKVCKNTAQMLADTRYKEYFEILGDTSTHYGEFIGCATTVAIERKDREDGVKKEVTACC